MTTQLITDTPDFEIIQIPREAVSFQDAPTVAEYFLPYATAQDATPTDNAGISISRIWKAWAHATGFYTEM